MTRALHRLLRRQLPAEFRGRHGPAMEEVFLEAMAAARRRGVRPAARLWLREAIDLAATGRRLHAERRRYGAGFVAHGVGRRDTHMVRGRGTMGISDDVRYAVRSLVRRPALTIFAALTVALGVGSTTAIFSTLEAVILNPLPYEGADRMVSLMRSMGNSSSFMTPAGDMVEQWRERSDLFEAIETWSWRDATLTGEGDARQIQAGLIRPSFHGFIGREPILGRAFDDSETVGEGARVVLLSYGTWDQMFGRDPAVLGRTLQLSGEAWTIVGVMPKRTLMPGFGLIAVDVWRPLSDEDAKRNPSVVAFLREGVELEMANARLAEIRDPSADSDSREAGSRGVARLIADDVGGGVRGALGLLMGAVVLLLLIACVNVSNLLLFRANARRRETAVRSALGGGRGRLVRQLLVESVLLAMLGGLLGVGLAYLGQDVILALRPERLNVLDHVGINGRVLTFALSLTLVTGVLFGLTPAVQAGRPDALEPLRSGARSEGDVVGGRSRWFLVAGEIALSFALLLGSLSVLAELSAKQRSDVGYRADEVAVMQVELPGWRYEDGDARRPVFEAMRDRIATIPGVVHVSLSSGIPPRSGVMFGRVEVEGGERSEETHVFHGPSVDTEYFATLGHPILEGRGFTADDLAGSENLIVLGEETSRRFFPDGNAVGKRFRTGRGDDDWITVVGVAADVAMLGLASTTRPLQAYHPHQRMYTNGTLLARVATGADPEDVLPLMRQIAREVDAEVRVDRLVPASELMAASLERERFTTTIMGAFALMALLLAAVGLYGVVSQVVGQRTREIGIRMALGARRRSIASLVMRRAGGATTLGILAGIALAMSSGSVLESRVPGLEGVTSATYGLAALTLAAVAALAAWMPARRASRIDPVEAMRVD